ncbi:myrosinase 1 isoform X3 [Cryptotermes secundus]|uniref:myrosinase 1 isoform X3 n=1 Tax=Cryptotermes secundus TaxID=105785 RepID=UPI001454C205|nr:myrosinase 1 isoform X3 [Cryptotermes secundus]
MKRLLCYITVLMAEACAFSHQNVSNQTFPTNFLIGAATSAFQIEGAWNESGKGVSIWDTYVHTRPFIVDGSTGDIAADSYHLYKQDIKALKELGVDLYRFSISWPRILPTGLLNVVNQAGIDYYSNLINELKANDIEPMVKWWITINEPINIAFGYDGNESRAPGVDARGIGGYLAVHTIIRAHAKAYRLYDKEFRSKQEGKVSLSIPTCWFEPVSNSTDDAEATEMQMQLTFGLFTHPIYSSEGDYPSRVRDILDRVSAAQGLRRSTLRHFTNEEILNIRGTYDFFGLNYYSLCFVKSLRSLHDTATSEFLYADITVSPEWATDDPNFRVAPWGFRKLLNWIKKEYNNVPVFVTENGFPDGGDILDIGRIKYIVSHMSEIVKAIHEDGCNVTGYTVWSLIDNMEWEKGYTEKYGLYHVNFSDPNRQRKPKSSAYIFSEITRKRELPRYFLDITGEFLEIIPSEIIKERNAQISNSSSSRHNAASWGWKLLTYSKDFLIIMLATVIISCFVFRSS